MSAPKGHIVRSTLSILLLCGVALLVSCRKTESLPEVPEIKVKPATVVDTSYMVPTPIGNPVNGNPWIAKVISVDLDGDGLLDVVACEAKEGKILWIRQVARGRFEETVLAEKVPAPVHVDAVDINGDGHLDLLVACMGVVYPDNDKIGTVLILENDGKEHFKPHVILENVARVTDVRAGDFSGEGRLDLVVGQFGYDQGEIRLLERVGQWEFKSKILLNLSGTINVLVGDFCGHGRNDIVALVSQQYEEIFLFENKGGGKFEKKIIFGSTNEDYASSNITLCDLNKDGRPDVLYSNGDGFGPNPVPGSKPWHGVQWLENLGEGNFRFHRIGDQGCAYSPIEVDLDGDGNKDVVAVSAMLMFDKPEDVSMVWYRNDGKLNFTPHVLAYEPIELLTVAAGDFDGTGQPSLVTGAFFGNPPYDRLSRITLWRRPEKK